MSNMFGRDQHHPSYDPRTKLRHNEVMLGSTCARVYSNCVIYERADGRTTSGRVVSADEAVVVLWSRLFGKKRKGKRP